MKQNNKDLTNDELIDLVEGIKKGLLNIETLKTLDLFLYLQLREFFDANPKFQIESEELSSLRVSDFEISPKNKIVKIKNTKIDQELYFSETLVILEEFLKLKLEMKNLINEDFFLFASSDVTEKSLRRKLTDYIFDNIEYFDAIKKYNIEAISFKDFERYTKFKVYQKYGIEAVYTQFFEKQNKYETWSKKEKLKKIKKELKLSSNK